MERGMLERFFDYVEIKTKITSIFAFFMTLAYLFYLGKPINGKLTLLFFISMFLFDLTTTAINNYIDTKTNTQTLQFERKKARFIIYILFMVSAGIGLYIAWCTDLAVLLLGGLCFLCGVFYTYGPIPISRQPIGELFSGIFYGFLIPFILLYINLPKGFLFTYEITWETISISVMWQVWIPIILLSIAPICTTANIMLANNICDVEKDIQVKRFTLPYYLGEKSLFLFVFLYYIIYVAAFAMIVIGTLPILYGLFFVSLIPVHKNCLIFLKEQKKETTFMCSIKNYVIIMGADVLLLLLCGLLN